MSDIIGTRVGRDAKTRAQYQNWNAVKDQLQVIMLLDFIPASDGGAGGGLSTDRVVPGRASDALCDAILRFQKQHFPPAQQSGFVDPGDAVITRMEKLAWRHPAAPKAAGQWDEFQTVSVRRALREALKDDPHLSQGKVVDILYSTLSDGTVTAGELDDLQLVADKSTTIEPRTKAMLELFVKEARSKRSARGPYELATPRHIDAAEIVCNFLKGVGRGRWLNLDRDEIGVGMLMRLAYPGLLRQGQASLCGPAAFLFVLLQDRPASYARFAADMYDKGTAMLGGLSVTPNDSVRQYPAPYWQINTSIVGAPSAVWHYPPKIDPVDWVTMASLRDSENWFCTYDTADKEFEGATTPMELVWWLNKAGYSDVRHDFNLLRHQRGTENMDEASRLYSAGYRVCLLIDYQMIETQQQAESGSSLGMDEHWVVLRSRIDRSGGNVKMTIFTWGDANRQVPQSGVLPLDDFLMNYHGYVAGRP